MNGGILEDGVLTIPDHGVEWRFGVANGRRRLAATKDVTKTVLVVRVVADGRDPDSDMTDLSDKVFGTHGDGVNLKSQYEGCSHGSFTVEPASAANSGMSISNGNQIVDGVIEVRINYSGDDDMIMWQQAETALENQFGVNFLGFAFDHVMYCLPDLPGGWVAYGYIDYFRTVYNNEWCTYLSTQVVSIICRSNYTCYH